MKKGKDKNYLEFSAFFKTLLFRNLESYKQAQRKFELIEKVIKKRHKQAKLPDKFSL